MHKSFTPIVHRPSVVFREDVYIATGSVRVFAKRECSAHTSNNIFSILDGNEAAFLRRCTKRYIDKPYVLLRSRLGPVFINLSLYGSFGIFILIVPHFESDEIYALTGEYLSDTVLLSERIEELSSLAPAAPLGNGHRDFAQRLRSFGSSLLFELIPNCTNVQLSLLMSEISHEMSIFCGCEVETEFCDVVPLECSNEFSVESYLFTLLCFFMTVREYSATRSAKLYISFDEYGCMVSLSFDIASEHLAEKISDTVQMKGYFDRAYARFFNCYAHQEDGKYVLKGYPWKVEPDSTDLKEDIIKKKERS